MINWLLIFIPITFGLEFFVHPSDTVIFISAALAIIPIAANMGQATESLASKTGPTIGGLLNATFGNATELIIAFFALQAGKTEVVKASITGSMIGNMLLVLGLALFLGGLKYQRQFFNKEMAGSLASLLLIVMIAFLVPALFDFTERSEGIAASQVALSDSRFSLAASIVLIGLYVANMIFSLVTHKDLISTSDDAHEEGGWSMKRSFITLIVCTLTVAWLSEVLVGALEGFSSGLGLSEVFAGLIIIPIIGNAAEHSASVFAVKNKLDLSIQITLGATIQIALLVAPILVIASYLIGKPMDLVIHRPLELMALVGATLITASVSRDGESNWLEGAMLLGIYVLLALAFYYLPVAT
ncbi:MAG: calcium/proton exchanger [Alphaproteobacteria bacterium]|nr:calcium/proton exchanger [Alphaproteobacteria bacterium]